MALSVALLLMVQHVAFIREVKAWHPRPTQRDACIWNEHNDTLFHGNQFNGQWWWDGWWDDFPSYKKTTPHRTCGPTLYLYYLQNVGNVDHGQWTISETKGSTAMIRTLGGDGWYATCAQESLYSCVGGQWSVEGGINLRMSIRSGSCPYWSCNRITTNDPSGNCSLFFSADYDNAFRNHHNGYIWYWNPKYWKWMCVEPEPYGYASDYRRCSGLRYSLSTAHKWQDISRGQSLTMEIGYASTSISSLTVSCLNYVDDSSTTTTPQPVTNSAIISTPQTVTKPRSNPGTNRTDARDVTTTSDIDPCAMFAYGCQSGAVHCGHCLCLVAVLALLSSY
eukprot:63160_1